MKKRISTILLTIALMVTAMPAFAFADETAEAADSVPVVSLEDVTDAANDAVSEEAVTLNSKAKEVSTDAAMDVQEAIEISDFVCAEKSYDYVTLTWKISMGGSAYNEAVQLLVDGDAAYEVSGKKGSYTCTVDGLDPKTEYEFTVVAGDAEKTKTVTTKADTITIADITVSSKTTKTVTLKWTLNKGGQLYKTDDTDNLTVYARKSDAKSFKAKDVEIKYSSSTGKYTAKVTGLDAATAYTFKVKEVTDNKYKKIEAKTKKAVANVKDFKALSSKDSVILKWKKVKNATGYTIKWKSGSKSGKFKIKSGSTNTYVHNLPESLRCKKIKYTIVANRTGYGSSGEKTKATGEAVRTMHLSMYLNQDRVLTSHDKAHVTTTFKKGTQLDAYGYNGGRYVFDYKGHTYFVKRYSVSGQNYSQLDLDREYTKEEAESYVNKLGVASSTKNLIWVNTYTQTLYVFQGSKGNWKQIKGPWEVGTGQAKTPTSTGLTRVRSKSRGCYEPFPQTPYWCVCAQFSIHGKAPYYPAMGAPASHGCVRNWTKNAYWMYLNIPVGTSVYIF